MKGLGVDKNGLERYRVSIRPEDRAMTPKEEAEVATKALIASFRSGQLRQADIICRMLMARFPKDPLYPSFMGDIALAVRRPDVALEHYGKALRLNPQFAAARQGLMKAEEAQAWLQTRLRPTAERYLLIKAWGAGFWSDMDHVLSALLMADLTGRTPLVFWGDNSLFGSPAKANAWDLYFEPVSGAAIEQVTLPLHTVFPEKWANKNILETDADKWSNSANQTDALLFFNRDETVIVSDFYSGVNDLLAWIDRSSPYFGKSRTDIYRAIVRKFIRPLPDIQASIDQFWSQNMAGRRWLAVHIRGTDKGKEVDGLEAINESYLTEIDSILKRDADIGLFVLTDSAPMFKRLSARYGDRMIFTDSVRLDGDVGVHFSNQQGDEIGKQVILDTYLAARCDRFIGNGGSNVSLAVEYLKEWPHGRYKLLGADFRKVIFSFA